MSLTMEVQFMVTYSAAYIVFVQSWLDMVAELAQEACSRLPVRANFCQAWQMAVFGLDT